MIYSLNEIIPEKDVNVTSCEGKMFCGVIFELPHDKTTKLTVRPAKT